MTKIHYIKKDEKIPNITRIYELDTCYDLRAHTPFEDIEIEPYQWRKIGTGILMDVPIDVDAQIRPRSGIAEKFGVTVLNSPGTIDPGYKGEIQVILINHGNRTFIIKNGNRIAQLCFSKNKTTELENRKPKNLELQNMKIEHQKNSPTQELVSKTKESPSNDENIDNIINQIENRGLGSSGTD